MQWSDATPTEPGWYWFRDREFPKSPQIVLISDLEDRCLNVSWIDGGSLSTRIDIVKRMIPTCQWAGPIQEPT